MKKIHKIILTLIISLSFGLVSVNAEEVAQIGETKYETLGASITAANAGDTIKLIKNIELELADGEVGFTILADDEITLDLNGYKITGPGSATKKSAHIIVNKGSLTIMDSSSTKTGEIRMATTTAWSDWTQATPISNQGTLIINGGTISGIRENNAMTYAIDTNSTIGNAKTIINGGTIYSDYCALRAFNNSKTYKAEIIINGGEVKSVNRPIFMQNLSAVPSLVSITGGKVVSTAKDIFYIWDDTADLVGLTNINIEAGELVYSTDELVTLTTGSKANFAVSGGVYSTDVNEYVVDGKFAEKTSTGYEVKENVIAIGNKTYATLSEAVAAVPDNGETATTIKLLDNLTSSVGIFTKASNPKNIIFDLNGKTLTFAEGALVGSSGTVSQNIHVERGSVIVFKNGKMIASPDSRMFLQNYCDLTLLDVSIDASGVTTDKKYYAVSLNQGTINITGNTSIKSKSVAFDAYWWPDMGYNGGALVTVNTTGTIEGTIEVDASSNEEKSATILRINNINHNGSLNVLKDALKANVSISGGKYSTDVDAYVVEGKYAEKVGNVYEIKEYTQNVEITPVDPEKDVKETIVGLTGNEETEDTLIESLDEIVADDSKLAEKIKDTHVVVVVDVASVDKERLDESVLSKIEKVAKKATVVDYFDINVLINNDKNETLGIIPELTKEIELVMVLPEKLVNTDKSVNRKYYVIREHDGEVEILKDVKVSEDGKSIVFKSNKFSTYALAYEDEIVEEEKKEELPPKTGDVNLAMLIGTILVGAAGAVIISKKRFAKSN